MMETYAFFCETITGIKEAKALVKKYEGKIKSPCYINLITGKGEKLFYAEKSNVRIDGAGWIVLDKGERIG